MSSALTEHPDLPRLRALLADAHRCAIVTHYNPDGDAMGSSLGLSRVLRRMGHAVQVVLPNAPPPFLRWLPGAEECLAADTAAEACQRALAEADLVLCLDFNRPDRAGVLEKPLREARQRVLIDHHQRPDMDTVAAFSDTSACATSQMVVDLLEALGQAHHIDEGTATCLYTGIMTDSGSFRFSSTTPHTMRVAALLMERGAVPDRIHAAVMDDHSEQRMRLMGYMLAERMTVLHDLGCVVLVLRREDLQRFGFKPGDTEGFVNLGLSMRGIRLSAFFLERPDRIKISLRSKGALPVDRLLADHFEGGGHVNAAGGQCSGPIDACVQRFMDLLPAHLRAHPA
ncbi:MAG: bifunctional oligoribonuclease/PAP phosphatase NrnA [Flavobacteriales bacterium]|nr:Bifunctional oligoribonuclease and PAP phosphatase NrnA [Flavobacteriales bacterium]MCC6577736.1 bifunctional oligoribonuclease/PAP phosphatase NrnA [Flavobacteriales bacterium]NUQ15330.1 bifunctional oligoribonuclease/PAP phosphatase NrnA [Flavobacteriales bacterium]